MGVCSPPLRCPSSSPPIQTASDYSWHWHPNLQEKMSLLKCQTFVPHLRAIGQNSSNHSSLSVISSFQELRDLFSIFLTLVRAFRISGFFELSFGFSLVFFTPSFALSWIMTCSVCLCQTIIAVSLKMCSTAPITRTR